MCNVRKLTVAAVVLVVAAALPRAPADVMQMDLEEVLGRTTCPMKTVIDDDPLRLPRRIKFLTCERAPRRRCPVEGGPHACCTRRHHHQYSTQCVEVFDYVVVQYLRARNATQHVLRVPVGCVCVVLAGTAAHGD